MQNERTNNNDQGLVIGAWICFILGIFILDIFSIIGAVLGHYHWKNGGSRKAFWANIISLVVVFVFYFFLGALLAMY